jgi:hypothetical protein
MSESVPTIAAPDVGPELGKAASSVAVGAAVVSASSSTPAASTATSAEPVAPDDVVVPTWFRLEFEARVAQLYFGRRRVWFESCGRWARMLTLGLSSGAVLGLIAQLPWLLSVATMATALVSIAVVVFDFSGQQKRYEDGYRRVTEILQKIMLRRMASSSWQTRLELRNEYDAVAALEPRTFAALSIVCMNYNLASEGFSRDVQYFIPWYQRLTCQVISWSPPYETNNERDARRAKQAA